MSSTSQNPNQGQYYDGAGNVTYDGLNSYLYDGEGRICAVQLSASGLEVMTQYIYDAEGNRVAKGTISAWSCDTTMNGFTPTTAYVLGPGGEQLSELSNDSGTWQWAHTNVYAAGQQIATYEADQTGATDGAVYFHLSDWLGTRRQQTDYAGNPVLNFTGLPFGDGLATIPVSSADVADATEHHFTGKERDTESGNDYFIARYYGSSMGRFLSADDGTDQDPSDPQSWNLYAYVRNNPLINTDPDGHDCVNASNAANGTISVQTTQNASDCMAGYTYVDGTVGNSYTYSNGQVGFNISNYADGSGTAGSVTMASGSQLDPDTLKAGVFGSPSASTWRNANGVVTAAASAELMAASVVAPELLLEDTKLMGGLGLEMEATQNLEIVAADDTKITGYTEHGMMRASGNGPAGTPGVRAGTKPQAILDALKNPKSIKSGVDQFERPFKNFIGQDAKVTVNPSTGKIVSVNPLSGAGARWMTMNNQNTFHLSAKDAEYLSKLMSEDSSFKNLLPNRLEFRIDQEALTLNHDEAKLLRDYFTDRLAKVGFDENYEPNEEGVMLERLTDLLFLPDEKWVVG